MQLEQMRAAVIGALLTQTPEQLAAEVGGVTANTLRNLTKPNHSIRGPTARALAGWLARRSHPKVATAVVAAVVTADPVASMVRTGQAEAAAWVLEFAARLLEAGAQQLRQGVQREAIISAVEHTEARLTQPKTSRRRASEA